MLADAIDSSLKTLQQGLNGGVCSSSCNSVLLDTALSVLQLSTAAVQHCAADDDENAAEVSDGHSSYSCVQQQRKQKDLKFEAAAAARSSAQPCALSRRSSLRSTASGSPRHSSASRRRSISFKEADSLRPAVASQRDSCSASVSPSAHGCELVVELPGVAAGLLSEALAGSSPTHLEVDLVLHEAAASSTAQQAGGSASAALGAEGACTGQPRSRQFVRTPSGGVVRRTGSDAGTLLSPSGKEVWAQVRWCRACACGSIGKSEPD